MTAITIIDAPAGTRENDQLAAIIGDAFSHLEVSKYLIPDDRRRADILAAHLGQQVNIARGLGRLLTDTGRGSAAVWIAVARSGLLHIPGYHRRRAEACGPHTRRFEIFEDRMHERHPVGQRHWYLALMGVRPELQGHGLGTALLQHQLAALDEQRVPAYLEASDLRSRSFYLRHGFIDRGEAFACGPDGPLLFPMWREPQPVSVAAGEPKGGDS